MTDRAGVAAVEAAARTVFQRGWVDDGSLFSTSRAIWTAEHLDELYEHYVLHPRRPGTGFAEVLRAHLEAVSAGGRQLVAELLYLNVLPLTDVKGSTKRDLIATVLEWTDSPASIPAVLDHALDFGVFNGGVGFNIGRWRQLILLVETVRQFKQRPSAERAHLLSDPWSFRDFIRGIAEPPEPAQRNALLYLAFPASFPPVVISDDRRRIVAAFQDKLGHPAADVDRDLAEIRDVLAQESGGYVDFYRPPWDKKWRTSGETKDLAPDVKRAWLVRGSNVGGHNLVPTWLKDRFVSLQTRNVAALAADMDRDTLKEIIEDAYSDVSYSQRQQKLNEVWSFVARMHPGDIIATASQGDLFVGRLTGEPTWAESPGGRSNLRREVVWAGPDAGVDYAKLSTSLSARLQSQHDVIDLTQQLSELEALLEEEVAPPADLHLPAVTDALADGLLVTQPWLQECVDLLSDRPQLIFYGPPGTGKTFLGRQLAWHLAGPENTYLVQFHPSYSYEDFFEGFRPVQGEGGTIAFRLQPGPFRRLVDEARAHPEAPYVLIIDEINRGNLAKIFGELYFLLEYRDAAIGLLYSAGTDQAFTMPPNVFVIGTMNTADRSIALVDAAMRRRFAFVALDPADEPTRSMLTKWLQREKLPPDAAVLLDRLNAEIADPDFRIGPSYFMRRPVYEDGGLDRMWRTSILPLLAEHHFGEDVDVAKRYSLARLRPPVLTVEPMMENADDGASAPALSAAEPGAAA
jgi:5-methylcytosine-specific restriction protein B